jgi:hypothetical protein
MNNALCVISTRGARRRPEHVEQILSVYEASGLTQREFAQQAGMGYSTLTYWLRRRRREGVPLKPARWWPVEVKPEGRGGGAYQVQSAAGPSVRIPCGFDPAEVRTLLELVGVCSR